MDDEFMLAQRRRENFLEMRKSHRKLAIGGWAWNRKLSITLHSGAEAYRLSRPDKSSPYECVELETGESISLSDAPESNHSNQRFAVHVNKETKYEVEVHRGFLKSPEFEISCIGSEAEFRVSRVGGQRWYQYDFLASECGDLQIDMGFSVYSSGETPLPLAIGLQLFIDARFNA